MTSMTDLLGSHVLTAEGTDIGQVREVSILQDGPVIAGVQAAMRVDSLLVGPRSLGLRLGYGTDEVHGPWLLAALFRRSERRVRTVPYTDVERWDDEGRVVHLRAGVPATVASAG
jgi:sporulation protein YlmC with PRC-barrel domain